MPEALSKGSFFERETLQKNIVFLLLKLGIKKAGDGNRTHVSSLEGWCSTIELHPQNIL